MKKVLSKVLGASLMSVGLVAVSATDAFGGQTPQNCSVDNIFNDALDLEAEFCKGSISGNDKKDKVEPQFQELYQNLINDPQTSFTGSVTNDYKLDSSSGLVKDEANKNLFEIINDNGDKSSSRIQFYQDIDYKFSFVLKAGNTWSSYFFDGIEAGTILDFTTGGVSKNQNGNRADLSHATLYVSDIEVALREEQNKQRKVYVPEPSAVVGLAFLGGGMFLSRRRKSS